MKLIKQDLNERERRATVKTLAKLLTDEKALGKIWDAAHFKLVNGQAQSVQVAYIEGLVDFLSSSK